jgi:hypothetical protein
MTDEQIMEVLRSDSGEFSKICQEHRQLNAQIDEANKKHFLTPEEEIDLKRMQKEKLQKKDRIAELVREYRKSHQN